MRRARALGALLLAAAAATAAAQALLFPDVPLGVRIDKDAVFADGGRTCHARGERVKRGAPAGCGEGCQHADEVVAFSSEYVYEGEPTAGKIRGAPDVYPSSGLGDGGAWLPLRQDAGTEFITVRVPEPVYVTGMVLYETHHPGAVYLIEGQPDFDPEEDAPEPAFVPLWTGTAAPPPGSSVYEPATGTYTTTARAWYPPGLVAPRTTRLRTFRIALNTALVPGFNAIDAVKVFGDTESGTPVRELTPLCDNADDDDCYHVCTESDVVSAASAAANMRVVGDAALWLARALRVRGTGSAPFRLPVQEGVDPAAPFCGGLEGVPIPLKYESPGISAQTRLVVFVTNRPDPLEPLRATACRFDRSARSLGRPVAVHLNVVPSFGLVAEAAGNPEVRQAAVDAVTHFLYLAIGFAGSLRTRFMISPGVDVRTEQTIKCTQNDAACAAAWEERYLVTMATPNMLAMARDHFNLPSMLYVELENGVTMTEESHINSVFNRWNGEGGKGVLLEHRLFAGELMTLPAYAALARANFTTGSDWAFPTAPGVVTTMAKSAISLGLLQDTGWYFPDYAVADVLPWGRNLGAEFVLNKCNFWPESANTHVCPRTSSVLYGQVFDSGIASERSRCNADRTYKGRCLIADHPAGFTRTLPAAFQYFVRPAEAHFGGYSELHDFCPVTFPYAMYPPTADAEALPWSDGIAGAVEDCRMGSEESRTALAYLETKGYTSRCFEVSRARVEHPACLKHDCSANGELSVFLAGAWRKCPVNGGALDVASEAIVVACPPAVELCERWPRLDPDIVVLSPTPRSRVPIDSVLSFELANFAIGSDGILRVSAVSENGVADVIAEVTSDPTPTSIVKVVNAQLPYAEEAVLLRFELVASDSGFARATKELSIFVSNSIQMYVSAVHNTTSEYVEIPDISTARLVSAIVGEPDVPGYDSDSKAWAVLSVSEQGATEMVEVDFPRECYPTQLDVWQSFGAGRALASVAALPSDAPSQLLWEGQGPAPPLLAPALTSKVQPYSVDLRQGAPRTRRLRVSFRAPPWAEIDAMRVLGMRETPPSLALSGDGLAHITVAYGAMATRAMTVKNEGSSVLVWELRALSGGNYTAAGFSVSTTHGALRGGGSLVLNVTAHADAMRASGAFPYSAITVGLFNRFASSLSAPVATITLTATAVPGNGDAAGSILCYHGVAVQERADRPAECRCLPGAYGAACEFRHCPGNCTGANRAGGFAGVCDKFTGTCVCASGYDGMDCSGKEGDCYVSFDGSCRPGFDAGTFVMNAEDEGNLNRGGGVLPRGLACDSAVSDANELGCAAFPKLQTCCRPTTEPNCPFMSKSAAPCAACSIEVWRGTTPEGACLEAISAHCLAHPGEAACHPFLSLPLPLPIGYCPYELALQHCTTAGGDVSTDPLCASVSAPAGVCAFEEHGTSNPCSAAACKADDALFAPAGACRSLLETHCFEKHPADRACDAFGLGDGCPFEPDSAPCLEASCAPWYDEEAGAACTSAIEKYCTLVPTTDAECLARGYAGPLSGAVLPYGGSVCPWAAAYARCAVAPLEPQCVRLRAFGGLRARDEARALEGGGVGVANTTAAEAYAAAYRKTVAARFTHIARLGAAHAAFAYGDADGDGALGPHELDTAVSWMLSGAQTLGAPLRALAGSVSSEVRLIANPGYPTLIESDEFVANVVSLVVRLSSVDANA